MARMNKLSEEIGERSNNRKYEFVDTKGQRLVQIAVVGLFLMLLVVVSFVLACQNKKGKDSGVEDESKPASKGLKSRAE